LLEERLKPVATFPSQSAARAPRKRRSSGVVIPHHPRWYQRAGAWLIFALVQVVAATLRFRWEDRSGYFEGSDGGPAIYCVWHNRLALSMTVYYRYVRKRQAANGIAALVSASKDGGFLAAILECFGVEPVRGSSSRRGPQALLELTTWAERGYDLAITPDGPRGPCGVVQEGVTSLAQITGLPIIPASYDLNWKLRFNTWDRFQIPLPFARCVVKLAPPFRIPREATDAEREKLRQELERKLREMSEE
jgi:lysophospholipid acyltransferase (LPLAT)-like uncharacterized protein